MKTNLIPVLVFVSLTLATHTSADAQNAAVAQMYGKGVHAYYAGDYTTAREYLSMAIGNGSKDPRAYYFRGIVANAQGSTYEAESDWQQGAQLEARGTNNPQIGRSLTRFQGASRLKLEEIRQKARLDYAAIQAARANMRAPQPANNAIRDSVINPPVTPPPPIVVPGTAQPPAATPAAPPAAEDPFSDDLAEGEANVTEEDALEGAMDDPFADEAAPATADSPADEGADPFAGGDDDPGLFDDGGADAAADDSDPFADGGEDPFAE